MTRSGQPRGARQPASGWGVWPRPYRRGAREEGATCLSPHLRRALLSHVCHCGVCRWPVQLFLEVGRGVCLVGEVGMNAHPGSDP